MTDKQLLSDYADGGSEEVFTELVQRHVDLVYSIALKMVRDAHLAEDVTQSVFVALSQNASHLIDHAVPVGWLYRTTRNLAANAVRLDARRRSREQEAALMNELISTDQEALWKKIAPSLDAALDELSELDRNVILLRYYERKSTHEIAKAFDISKDAAKKRVSRAVERLREFFVRRGVSIGASSFVAFISSNAVQAAPVGLVTTISTATTLAGTTLTTSAIATSTKAVAMTTLQKTIAVTALAAVIGTPLVIQQHTLNDLRNENKILGQVAARVDALREESESLAYRDSLAREVAQLQVNHEEILQLREETAVFNSAENVEEIQLHQKLDRLQQEVGRINNQAELLANGVRIAELIEKDLNLLFSLMESFALENNQQLPASFEELMANLNPRRASKIIEQFGQIPNWEGYELFPQSELTQWSLSQPHAILAREGTPRLLPSGKWMRTYLLMDGVHHAISDSPDFSTWEQEQMKSLLALPPDKR